MAKDYADIALVYVDNVLMLDCQGVSFGNEQSDHEIHNITDGLAGMSRGTSKFKMSVQSSVPRAGMQYDLDAAAQERRVVEVSLFIGDKSLTTKGWVQNVKGSWGIDKAAEFSFEFTGNPATLS